MEESFMVTLLFAVCFKHPRGTTMATFVNIYLGLEKRANIKAKILPTMGKEPRELKAQEFM